jgi:methyltransferase (TIGR00027 family)
MSKIGTEQHSSRTAIYTALSRAIASKEFDNQILGSDYLAEKFLPFLFKLMIKGKKLRARMKQKIPLGLYEYMIVRTAYFDNIFIDALNKSVPQIVLLGSGYDTRAYRFAKLIKDTRIIELDISPTQNIKKKYLFKAHIEIPNKVVFAPINFDDESLKEVLGKVGYDENEKSLFIMEGVSYYLEPESVGATLRVVKSNLNVESAIGFDYAISVPLGKLRNYYGLVELLEYMTREHPNERGKFLIEEGEIESYLEQRGLKIVDHLDNKEMEKRFLTHKDGSLIGRVNGWFRIVVASPISKPQV